MFGLVKNMISRGSDEAFKDYTGFLLNILKSESDLLSYKNVSTPPAKTKPVKTKSNDAVAKPLLDTTLPKKIPLTGGCGGEDSTTKTKTVITKKPSRRASVGETATETRRSPLTTFMLVLVVLFLMNMYMLARLRHLEGSVIATRDNSAVPSWMPDKIPTTREEWNSLLDYQRSLHELELLRLKEVIGNTATLIEQVQTSMRMLYENVDKNLQHASARVKSTDPHAGFGSSDPPDNGGFGSSDPIASGLGVEDDLKGGDNLGTKPPEIISGGDEL